MNQINIKNDENINTSFNKNYLEILKNCINIINEMEELCKKNLELIEQYIDYSKEISLTNIINDFLMEDYKDENTKKEKFYEDKFDKLQKEFNKYFDLVSQVYSNNFNEKLKDLKKNLENRLQNLKYLTPINNDRFTAYFISPYFNNSNSLNFYENFSYDSSENETKNQNNKGIKIICPNCKKNEATYLNEKRNIYFCEDCKQSHFEKEFLYIISLDNIPENERENKIFCTSIEILIKSILIKCNYIINNLEIKIQNENEKDNTKDNKDKSGTIKYIRRKINFPFIKDINDFDSQIKFLKEINSILNDEFNITVLDDKSINKYEFNDNIIDIIKKLFFIIKDKFKLSLSSEDSFIDIKLITNYLKSDYEEIKSKLFLNINIISIENLNFNENIKKTIKNKINLLVGEDNIFISYSNTLLFIENFIKTQDFDNMPTEKIKKLFPDLKVLLEYKKIINDLFCEKFKIKNFLDFRGNFIIPNKSFNMYRGTEKYDPPYGWIGIGLKALGKYEDDDWLNDTSQSSKWTIAYHGVGRLSSLDDIIEMINNIIIEGLKPGPSQIKSYSYDKRHLGKKIGVGVYLTKSINMAEEFSGIIPFNNKKYRIVLMTKVLIEKIKEPEDYNYWILNNKYIRVYRILLKEKIN